MPQLAGAFKTRSLMRYLGLHVRGPGQIYLTGGTSAVQVGWRATTIDIDLKLHSKPPGIYEAIAETKIELATSIELAAPDEFIPPLPDWESPSPLIGKYGKITFFHYNFYSQALANISRGHSRDLEDVRMMHLHGLIRPERLLELFATIDSKLIHYPQIEPLAFKTRVQEVARGLQQ